MIVIIQKFILLYQLANYSSICLYISSILKSYPYIYVPFWVILRYLNSCLPKRSFAYSLSFLSWASLSSVISPLFSHASNLIYYSNDLFHDLNCRFSSLEAWRFFLSSSIIILYLKSISSLFSSSLVSSATNPLITFLLVCCRLK